MNLTGMILRSSFPVRTILYLNLIVLISFVFQFCNVNPTAVQSVNKDSVSRSKNVLDSIIYMQSLSKAPGNNVQNDVNNSDYSFDPRNYGRSKHDGSLGSFDSLHRKRIEVRKTDGKNKIFIGFLSTNKINSKIFRRSIVKNIYKDLSGAQLRLLKMGLFIKLIRLKGYYAWQQIHLQG